MKSFIQYIILLLFAILAIGFLIPFCFSGQIFNKDLDLSIKKYKNQKDNTEMILIGSSKIQYHINTQLLEKELEQLTKREYKVYNMGIAATNPPETYLAYEDLLESDHLSGKKVLLEVRAITEISFKNWWLTRSTYWASKKNVKFANKLVESAEYGTLRKFYSKTSHFLAYLSRVMDINFLRENLFNISDKTEDGIGFIPLENRKINCDQLENINSYTIEFIDNNKTITSSYHLQYLQNLIVKSESKNCQLVLYMAEANLPWQIGELIPLFDQLPERNKIAIVDPRKHSFLNDCSIKNNVTHFDSIGADMLTRATAIDFAKILNKLHQ